MSFRRVIPIDSLSYAKPGETDSDSMSRRDFMKFMAASMALTSAACSGPPQEKIYPYVHMPEGMVPGNPIYYATNWLRDGYAQGILVSTQMGRPVKVEGNPLHPASLGGTDVFAQAAVLQLWDPDRSQIVMQAGARNDVPQASSTSSWEAFEAAWRAQADTHARDGGAGLRILTGPLTSPTTVDAIHRLLQRYPQARWHRHAPASTPTLQHGDTYVDPVYHFDKASTVLAFDADPLSHGSAVPRYSRDWSAARKAYTGTTPINVFAVESTPGLLGAVAQQRMALPPVEVEALLWRLVAALGGGNDSSLVSAFEKNVVPRLRLDHGGSLIIAGALLSPAAHAVVMHLNAILGNIGHTIDYIPAVDASLSQADSLEALVADMHASKVETLLMLDRNPVYDAPGEMDFSNALSRVSMSIHLGPYRDETAVRCQWHLPQSHMFEQWSDARAFDGTAGIVQPCIMPLYDGRSALELLALINDEGTRNAYELVRRYWQAQIGDSGFDDFWHASLRTGVIANSASTPVNVSIPALPDQAVPAKNNGNTLTACFIADSAVADGSFANNGWLQELPRPLTKLTWDNAALLGPLTAAASQLKTGDIVQVRSSAGHIEAPVFVLPTHAEGCVTLPLGYGRRNAGRVGNAIGFDAYPLCPADGGHIEVTLHAMGKQHAFAITQTEWSMHDRPLVKSIPRKNAKDIVRDRVQPSLYPEPRSPVHAWAMSIDLDACIGCSVCTIACQAENNIPVVGKEQVARGREMHWIRVDRYVQTSKAGHPRTLFQPVPCMHCEEAPCEAVCPVGATVHDTEGLNVQVYNRCVGTRFCSNNCPYKVRRFNFLAYSNTESESLKALQNPDVTVRQRGVMEKCSYCVQRISRARIHSEKTDQPLHDGDVVTACEAACPTQAITFGDLNDANSRVSIARHGPRHYTLLEELNTRPRTTYLARIVEDDEEST